MDPDTAAEFDRARFSPPELQEILRHYDLGTVRQATEFRRGSRRSPKLILETDRGRFLLKRRPWTPRTVQRVTLAHALQKHLAAFDFPLAPLVPTADTGETAIITSDGIYEMFVFVDSVPYRASLELTYHAGLTLARFHTDVATFTPPVPPPRNTYHDVNAVRTGLNAIPGSISSHESVIGQEAELLSLTAWLHDRYDEASERVAAAGIDRWPVQMIHSDWHPGNMLFSEHGVLAVVDFDSVRLAPRAIDLANAALQFSIVGGSRDVDAWPDFLDLSRLKRFLLGYDAVSAASPDEARALPWLMVEALIAEAVVPIAATGSFGRIQGFGFLKMIRRKVQWLLENMEHILAVLTS